jgi:hypothetical protein
MPILNSTEKDIFVKTFSQVVELSQGKLLFLLTYLGEQDVCVKRFKKDILPHIHTLLEQNNFTVAFASINKMFGGSQFVRCLMKQKLLFEGFFVFRDGNLLIYRRKKPWGDAIDFGPKTQATLTSCDFNIQPILIPTSTFEKESTRQEVILGNLKKFTFGFGIYIVGMLIIFLVIYLLHLLLPSWLKYLGLAILLQGIIYGLIGALIGALIKGKKGAAIMFLIGFVIGAIRVLIDFANETH